MSIKTTVKVLPNDLGSSTSRWGYKKRLFKCENPVQIQWLGKTQLKTYGTLNPYQGRSEKLLPIGQHGYG